MIRVVICGTGNVAGHLFDAFIQSDDVDIVQVAGRNPEALQRFATHAATTTELSSLAPADIYILAISDDAIEESAALLEGSEGLMVHTSGSIPMTILPQKSRRGVFYPLQTFSRDLKVDFSAIPVCVEAENEKDYSLLETLAGTISEKVVRISSQQRAVLHTAAVFVNNFTNHLYYIGQSICEERGVNFELLHALIGETARKIGQLEPLEAQTGPARRGDKSTMDLQLKMLETETQKDIYKTISKSIENTYGKKL